MLQALLYMAVRPTGTDLQRATTDPLHNTSTQKPCGAVLNSSCRTLCQQQHNRCAQWALLILKGPLQGKSNTAFLKTWLRASPTGQKKKRKERKENTIKIDNYS